MEVERRLDPASRNGASVPHAGEAAGRERDLADSRGSARPGSRPAPASSPQRLLLTPEVRCGAGSGGGR